MTIDEAVERLKAIYKADPSSIDRMAIAKATNALKRSKWILCSKRTPDEDGRYLVTRGSGEDTCRSNGACYDWYAKQDAEIS